MTSRTREELLAGPESFVYNGPEDNRPWMLDAFCGEGGAGMGYWLAGFNVLGVDIKPQPNYPFDFVQEDALVYLDKLYQGWDGGLLQFAAFHASPPCQFATQMSARWRGKGTKADEHPDLLTPTRAWFKKNLDQPWVIENVPGARRLMEPTVILHGGMFGLGVHRPRLFESNVFLLSMKAPVKRSPVGVYGKPDGRTTYRYRNNGNYKGKSLIRAWKSLEEGSEAMGIDWMTVDGLREAIPPAYTEYIGRQLIDQLERVA